MRNEKEIRERISIEAETYIPVEKPYQLGSNLGWIRALMWVLGEE